MLSPRLVHTIFFAYYLILLARVIFSWLPVSARSPLLLRLRGFTYDATEPLLRPIRRVLAPYQRQAPVDFSPLKSGRSAFVMMVPGSMVNSKSYPPLMYIPGPVV